MHQISIIPRGMAGGYTMQLPAEDRSYRTRAEMQESLIVLLGGRVAEALTLGRYLYRSLPTILSVPRKRPAPW